MADTVCEFRVRNRGSAEFASLSDDLLRSNVPLAETERRLQEFHTNELSRLLRPANAQDDVLIEGDAPIQPSPELIGDLLGPEDVFFIGGQSGAAKTFMVVEMAGCLGTATPFFGRSIREKVAVIIVAAEGAGALPRRFAAVRQDKYPGLDHLPIAWISSPPTLESDYDVEAFGARLKEIGKKLTARFHLRLGAIFFDTVAAIFNLEDEDNNSEAARTLAKARALQRATRAAIGLVHHYGKTSATGLRGASAWRAGADTVISVTGDRSELTGEIKNRRIACSKNRDGEEGPIADFELRFVELGVKDDGSSFGSCVIDALDPSETSGQPTKLNDRHKNALAALVEIVNSQGKSLPKTLGLPASILAVPVEAWRNELLDRGIIAKDDKNKRTTFSRITEKLRASNLIAEREESIWIVSR